MAYNQTLKYVKKNLNAVLRDYYVYKVVRNLSSQGIRIEFKNPSRGTSIGVFHRSEILRYLVEIFTNPDVITLLKRSHLISLVEVYTGPVTTTTSTSSTTTTSTTGITTTTTSTTSTSTSSTTSTSTSTTSSTTTTSTTLGTTTTTSTTSTSTSTTSTSTSTTSSTTTTSTTQATTTTTTSTSTTSTSSTTTTSTTSGAERFRIKASNTDFLVNTNGDYIKIQ